MYVLEEPGILRGGRASRHEHVVLIVQPDEAEVARSYGQCCKGQTLLPPLLLDVRIPMFSGLWLAIQ